MGVRRHDLRRDRFHFLLQVAQLRLKLNFVLFLLLHVPSHAHVELFVLRPDHRFDLVIMALCILTRASQLNLGEIYHLFEVIEAAFRSLYLFLKRKSSLGTSTVVSDVFIDEASMFFIELSMFVVS